MPQQFFESWVLLFFLGKCLERQLLHNIVLVFPTFGTFSKVTASSYVPVTVKQDIGPSMFSSTYIASFQYRQFHESADSQG